MKLPSKLTTFEKFLYFDDYAAYPNTISCHLTFSGCLDQKLVFQSAEIAAQRHPLLKTVMSPNRKKPSWAKCLSEPMVRKLPGNTVGKPFVKKIDLHAEPGGQLHWADDGDSSSLNFLTHHAAADGLGGLQVVFDFLTAYSGLLEARSSNVADPIEMVSRNFNRLDPELLNLRANYGLWKWKFLKRLPRQLIGLLGVNEFFRNRPETLTGERHGSLDEPIPEDYPGFYTRELGDIELVQKKAGKAQVTANELILLAVFRAVALWRVRHQMGNENDCIRLMVPMNLRTISDRYLPASHRSSMITLDRVQSDCEEPTRLLNSIRFQMNVIRKNDLGYTFLHMLNLFQWLPKGLRRFADPERVGSTMVVTNLGEPFRRLKLPRNDKNQLVIGEHVVKKIDLIAPLRPNTQAAIAIGRYARKAFLTMTYDPRALERSLAIELTDLICDEFLRHSADGPS